MSPYRLPVALFLGSNLGNRWENLKRAVFFLEAAGGLNVLTASSVYETQPVDAPPQPWFFNQVLVVATDLPPGMLFSRCNWVESALGRRRNVYHGPRHLDVDILLYGGIEMATARLTLPHRALHRRRCVLTPLSEVLPSWIHPRLGMDVAGMLSRSTDPGEVRLVLPELENEWRAG